MALPESVVVGPHTFMIQHGGSEWDDDGKPDYWGITDHVKLEIRLDPRLEGSLLRETLLHEVLHACYFSAGIDLSLMPKKQAEENAVSTLSPTLFATLASNRAVLDYFFSEKRSDG